MLDCGLWMVGVWVLCVLGVCVAFVLCFVNMCARTWFEFYEGQSAAGLDTHGMPPSGKKRVARSLKK